MQSDAHAGSIMRNRKLDYELLEKFNAKSCNVISIEMPDMDRSVVHKVRFTNQKAAHYYHAKDLKQITSFKISYVPIDNSEGAKLIPLAKQLVEDVLKDDYKPATAHVTQLGKDGVSVAASRVIEQCIITHAQIDINSADYVQITFVLHGIMASSEG